MASQTSALPDGSTLTKPAYTDSADIAVINTNMDKIVSNINAENQALSKVNGKFIDLGNISGSNREDFAKNMCVAFRAKNILTTPCPVRVAWTGNNNFVGVMDSTANWTKFNISTNDYAIFGNYQVSSGTITDLEQLALKSDALLTPTLILEQIPTTSGENTYNCNWAIYKVLIIAIGNYGNIYNTLTIPTSEFGVTANGHAIFFSYGGGSSWSMYQNGQSSVKIIAPSSIQANTRIRIWGM